MTDILPGILEEACKKVEGITHCLAKRTDRFGLGKAFGSSGPSQGIAIMVAKFAFGGGF